MAVQTVKLIRANLLKAYADGADLEARQKLQEAAFCSGRAFTRGGLGYACAMARPLSGLAPCWLFARAPGPRPEELVWVPLADRPKLAALLGRGWGAVSSETTAAGVALGLCPV